ncbi:MAG TPA: hypothetical protein EYP04_08475 [Anaerolineae bacterium]|nr:hypothetical protein [Anaerolineae bacterium]
MGGIVLTFLGFYFLARNFGMVPEGLNLGRFWPLLLVIPGAFNLSRTLFPKTEDPWMERRGTHLVGSLVLLGLGFYFLADELGFSVEELLLPLLLLLIGIGLLGRSFLASQ